eukprot:XP_017952507.1 PREDICTED: interleukin-31 receptor subunit alpha [Xenopus tropicalis]
MNISGAAYNLTLEAFNSAEKTPPWSSVIEEDIKEMPFKNVSLDNKFLTVQWKVETKRKGNYCIEWKPTGVTSRSSNSSTGVYKKAKKRIRRVIFQPMQCYRIVAHKFTKGHFTFGTTYYFRPSLSIGPGNFTLMYITEDSVLLKWDKLDLHQCQGLLRNWVLNITKHENIPVKVYFINASATQYAVEKLAVGSNYTFEIKGFTIFGEYTGSRWTAIDLREVFHENALWIPKLIGGIFACLVIVGLCYFVIVRCKTTLFPSLPNLNDSSALKIEPYDINFIELNKLFVDAEGDQGPAEPLTIESVEENAFSDWVTKTEQLDNPVFSENDADLPFEYRRQMHQTSPVNDKDITCEELFKSSVQCAVHQPNISNKIALFSYSEDTTSVEEL